MTILIPCNTIALHDALHTNEYKSEVVFLYARPKSVEIQIWKTGRENARAETRLKKGGPGRNTAETPSPTLKLKPLSTQIYETHKTEASRDS